MRKCFQVLLAPVAAKKLQLLTQAPVLSSPFSCVSHWLPSSGFLPFRPWVFFSQETKRRKKHKRNNKEPKRKEKNRHRSLHSLSHMNTTEGETKRNHKTKKGKKKQTTNKNGSIACVLFPYVLLSPHEFSLTQSFLSSFLPLFLSPFLSFLPSFRWPSFAVWRLQLQCKKISITLDRFVKSSVHNSLVIKQNLLFVLVLLLLLFCFPWRRCAVAPRALLLPAAASLLPLCCAAALVAFVGRQESKRHETREERESKYVSKVNVKTEKKKPAWHFFFTFKLFFTFTVRR